MRVSNGSATSKAAAASALFISQYIASVSRSSFPFRNITSDNLIIVDIAISLLGAFSFPAIVMRFHCHELRPCCIVDILRQHFKTQLVLHHITNVSHGGVFS
jgi:predicted membrane-bound spermidine synthase